MAIPEHPKNSFLKVAHTNTVDGHDVPVPHFYIILGWDEWKA